MFFGCSCVSGRSELTPLLPAGFGPITSLGTRRRLTLSPRHSSPGRAPHGTCPGVPTAAGAAPGPVHTTPFCSLGRGSGALKPGRKVQGHGEEGGPIPGTAARGTRCGTPRSHARSPHPEAEPGGQSPAARALGAAPALTLSPERRQQRQEQEQPQRPGPAEGVHQRGALFRAGLGSPAASSGLPLFLAAAAVIPAA